MTTESTPAPDPEYAAEPAPDPVPAAEPPAGSDPAALLAELLEAAPPDERREITAWLLRTQRPPAAAVGMPWLPPPFTLPGHREPPAPGDPQQPGDPAPGDPPAERTELVRRLAGGLPAGTDSQVVTLRLPAERHAALREWCAAHGFSMAAVVRGLVERFLEQQAA
jgi:hypothetical protein